MRNSFILPDETYQRDLNVIAGYYNDSAKYLHLHTGQPFEQCLAFVKEYMKPGTETGFKDPKALVINKDQHGDRSKEEMSFMRFLSRVSQKKLLLSPSMAAYLPETQRQSTHAQYIAEGVANRKRVKREMFVAEENKDFELAKVKDGEQNNLKINNNAYSGATVSTATILYYKSTHSSLTSTCRTATTYANSANEKFIAGNRHYYTPEITKSNLVSIINLADLDAIQSVCDTFGLAYPTVQNVMDCIKRSTEKYWASQVQTQLIEDMVSQMKPVERAAVVYTADLYHLHKHNPEFVVELLKNLATVSSSDEYTVTDEEFKGYHEDVQMLANFLCFDQVNGRPRDKVISETPEVWQSIKNTAKRVLIVLQQFETVIKAFWLTPSMPSSPHAFPSAYRRAAIVSDTDSTMFTLMYWVEQCYGHLSFSVEAKRIVFVMVFLISELIIHILAQLSANMGVSVNKLRMLAMKNEYYFAVLCMTTRSKHYYASQDAREGLMFEKPKLEVKGVGLRDSKVPKKINDGAKEMMEEVINTIKTEKKLDMRDILKRIGDIERSIQDSILSGSPEYMTTGQIRAKESYKHEDNATYLQYELWQEVFAPFLGTTKPPPYSIVKVSLVANNKTEIDEWCDRMNNPKLAERLKNWLFTKRRTSLSTLMVPAEVVETSGIPKEIIAGVDTRKIISNTMAVYYLMLESKGIFLEDKNITRLISDSH